MAYFFLLTAVVSVILTSYISLLPLAGVSQGDISDMYMTSITPAGFTFSIWSLIYTSWILLGLYAVYMRKKGKKYFYLAVSIFLSVIWLFPWHYNIIWLSLIIMLCIFGLLVYIFQKKRYKDKYFKYTLELYLGWILIALIANIHIFLVSVDLYIFPITFTLLSLLMGLTLIAYTINNYRVFIPSYVFLWALLGVFIAQEDIRVQLVVIITALILTTLILHKHPKTSYIFR